MSRTFTYRFENDFEIQVPMLDKDELRLLERENGKCTHNGWAVFMGVGEPSRLGVIGGSNTRGDGFRTGYNPALGMEIKSPSHFKQVLKEKGLREVGNEKPSTGTKIKKSYIDDEMIKQAVDSGAKISGQEASALIEGKSLNE